MPGFAIRPFRPDDAVDVAAWSYEPPYDLYDGDPSRSDLYLTLDDEGVGYHAVAHIETCDVVGFCCFGPEARVAGQEAVADTVDLGVGVRPDLVGTGVATRALPVIVEFARDRFEPLWFRAAVATFNTRSVRLCRSAGFEVAREFDGPGRRFYELIRRAQPD